MAVRPRIRKLPVCATFRCDCRRPPLRRAANWQFALYDQISPPSHHFPWSGAPGIRWRRGRGRSYIHHVTQRNTVSGWGRHSCLPASISSRRYGRRLTTHLLRLRMSWKWARS